MTGAELRAIRERLGLDRATFGFVLGLAGAHTTRRMMVGRYETGGRPVPPTTGRLAEMLARHGVPEEFLKEKNNG